MTVYVSVVAEEDSLKVVDVSSGSSEQLGNESLSSTHRFGCAISTRSDCNCSPTSACMCHTIESSDLDMVSVMKESTLAAETDEDDDDGDAEGVDDLEPEPDEDPCEEDCASEPAQSRARYDKNFIVSCC